MKHLYLAVLLATLHAGAQMKYPMTRKENVTDDYFGTTVGDPYRWLENDRDPQTEQWVKEQNAITSNWLTRATMRERIHKRLSEVWNFNRQSAPYKKAGHYYCFRNNGLQNQSVLYILNDLHDKGQILLDPNTLSKDGTTSLTNWSVSNDGKYLAYGVSKAGSDWVEIHFMEIATRKQLPDVIKWVKFSGISWKGNGVYYSRYDEPSGSELTQKNEFHKVCFHKLGTQKTDDAVVYNDPQHPDYNFGATVTDDEKFMFISVSQTTSGEKLIFRDLRDPSKNFVTIANDFDNEYGYIDNIGETIYMRTNDHAPTYRLISFNASHPEKTAWKEIIPANNNLLEMVSICKDKLLACYLENASSHLYHFELDGSNKAEIQLPGLCRVTSLDSRKEDADAVYSTVSFVSPEQSFILHSTNWTSETLFKPASPFHSEDYETLQVFYQSADGTRIPMFITKKKGMQPDENTPAFVYGYGGFNISIAPEFRIDRTVFLEAGGIYCVPNIRGGGEFGEDWHMAGTKCKKQNVFDDFIAACDYLVKNKYTSYSKIAIHGRSNGGLLIGAVMTQRPDICKVALPAVGVLDMLRFHKFTIGRAWTVDYGCSENKDEFACLYKYSPLHNVRNTGYPATMVLTGDHDDRVVPAHSFKFAATLQEKNTSDQPMLIRIDVNAGHGAGKPTSKQIDEFADMWAFVFYNLGMQ